MQPLNIPERRHPPETITGDLRRRGKFCTRLEIGTCQGTVTPDIGMHDGGNPRALKTRRRLPDRQTRLLDPARGRHPALPGIQRDRDPSRMRIRNLPHKPGVPRRHGAEHHPPHARLDPALHRHPIADAPAELHRNPDGSKNRPDRLRIARATGQGSVQIDHMQPGAAGRLEMACLGRRILAIDGDPCHIAAQQADASAILDIDRRVENHGIQRRKLPSSRRPETWLFSG